MKKIERTGRNKSSFNENMNPLVSFEEGRIRHTNLKQGLGEIASGPDIYESELDYTFVNGPDFNFELFDRGIPIDVESDVGSLENADQSPDSESLSLTFSKMSSPCLLYNKVCSSANTPKQSELVCLSNLRQTATLPSRKNRLQPVPADIQQSLIVAANMSRCLIQGQDARSN